MPGPRLATNLPIGDSGSAASSSSTSDSPAASPAMRAPSASSSGTPGMPRTSPEEGPGLAGGGAAATARAAGGPRAAGAVGVVERHLGHAEDVAVERPELVEGTHRDPDVGDARAPGRAGGAGG